jgi:hypothetical protein
LCMYFFISLQLPCCAGQTCRRLAARAGEQRRGAAS